MRVEIVKMANPTVLVQSHGINTMQIALLWLVTSVLVTFIVCSRRPERVCVATARIKKKL